MMLPTRTLLRRTRPAALVLALLAGAGASAAQTTWYVDDDAPEDPGKGTPLVSGPEDGSSLHPFDSLSEAIAAAASGDTILVRPSNPEYTGLHYHEFAPIDLSGAGAAKALTIQSTNGPAVTVFEGLDLEPFDDQILIVADSGETGATVFDGFTLRGAGDVPDSADQGAAMSLSNASPTIRNCVFESNLAYIGAAIYMNASSSLVEDCVFSLNVSAHQGGAVYTNNASPVFSRCTFVGNSANFGGAWLTRTVSGGAPQVLDCVFLGNQSLLGYAGALAKFDAGTITIERTRFLGNSATIEGGGAHISGGGNLWDCIFSGNQASTAGGLSIVGSGTCTVTNSTFTSNTNGGVAEGAGVIVGVLRNCIVWGNTGFEVGPNMTVTYSDILGGYTGVTNLDVDPLFLDPDGLDGIAGTLDDDVSLLQESLCIDAGDTRPYTTRVPHVADPRDADGNARAVDRPGTSDEGIACLGLTVDLGALEVQLPPHVRPHKLP